MMVHGGSDRTLEYECRLDILVKKTPCLEAVMLMFLTRDHYLPTLPSVVLDKNDEIHLIIFKKSRIKQKCDMHFKICNNSYFYCKKT